MVEGVPLASEMDFASGFTFEVDLIPLINTPLNAQGAQLDLSLSNHVVLANIFVHNLYSQIIADVLNVDVEALIPLGFFAGFFLDSGLELLLSDLDDAVGVHLVDIGVTS